MPTPSKPETKAKVYASVTLIRPLATGRFAVRFMTASVSFSYAWLMLLADPVISIPAIKSKRTCNKSNLIFGASR